MQTLRKRLSTAQPVMTVDLAVTKHVQDVLKRDAALAVRGHIVKGEGKGVIIRKTFFLNADKERG